MMKSPSAKELGRHRMAPIIGPPNGAAGKKEESKHPSGLPLGSKVSQSSRLATNKAA